MSLMRRLSLISDRGCMALSQTCSSHKRAKSTSPCSVIRREAACTTSSGMARSDASSDAQACCSCAGSCASFRSSSARPRTILCAAVGEKARCLASSRAVSSACAVWRSCLVARSFKRNARVRRAAPNGNCASNSSAAAGSRSSIAQRVALS